MLSWVFTVWREEVVRNRGTHKNVDEVENDISQNNRTLGAHMAV